MITWPVCEQVTVRVILPTPHVGAVEQLPHAETFLHRSDLLVFKNDCRAGAQKHSVAVGCRKRTTNSQVALEYRFHCRLQRFRAAAARIVRATLRARSSRRPAAGSFADYQQTGARIGLALLAGVSTALLAATAYGMYRTHRRVCVSHTAGRAACFDSANATRRAARTPRRRVPASVEEKVTCGCTGGHCGKHCAQKAKENVRKDNLPVERLDNCGICRCGCCIGMRWMSCRIPWRCTVGCVRHARIRRRRS